VPYHVYLLSSRRNGTLYCGVTSDLIKRVWEHKEGVVQGFTERYGVKTLVWFETHEDVIEAIAMRSRSRNGSAPGSWR
jgi:putative endonuclease